MLARVCTWEIKQTHVAVSGLKREGLARGGVGFRGEEAGGLPVGIKGKGPLSETVKALGEMLLASQVYTSSPLCNTHPVLFLDWARTLGPCPDHHGPWVTAHNFLSEA